MMWLVSELTAQQLATLNSYLATLPSFPGFKAPSFGLATNRKATASEMADLFKLLPVALLAQPEQGGFLRAFQGESQSLISRQGLETIY